MAATVLTDEGKVGWGDDCPVCGANKSIIAGIDLENNRKLILAEASSRF